ncbi:hypothetical protein FA13DRAFT_1630185 [Coprinellus micaceus]|uniref:RING-type domain-containing protein n=1 Tax=Coprinellus micaceus TaxID=71717 RepID=A0A4Y7TAF8_COPMI|nr:hypothetical protein FA13DRAFT_1630185 [Coprinellus micaceus]
MLVAGPNSVCDVCLEPFGCDGKAPCSISCGHVFCVDCLDRVTKPSCPLCRNYFDSRATIKLHLDLDTVKPLSPSSNATDLDHDEDARRLRDAINRVTKEGCSESQIRQLIQDGNKFFQRAPKGRVRRGRMTFSPLS